jgi:hypothetical protein
MIILPTYPSPAAATPALQDFGSFLTPSLGGPIQRVDRMGTRFRIDVTMPLMPNPQLGRQWVAALVQGKLEGVRLPWPLLGFDPGLPGNVLVSGAGQSGKTLNVKGATPNYVFRAGQFFSLYVASIPRHYLYMITAQTVASATGVAALAITPMLRTSPPDATPLYVGNPQVEGFIVGDSFQWEMQLANFVAVQFQISEIE